MIKRAGHEDLKKAAEKIFGSVFDGIRKEMNAVKLKQGQLHDSIVAMNTQLIALDNRMRNEFGRSEASRRAVLKRLAELENKMEAEW